MTPKQFWETAASWGSAVTGGDPGACMYGFDERGLLQSEGHRRDCLAWIEHCRQLVDDRQRRYQEEIIADFGILDKTPDEFDAHAELDALETYIKAARIEGELPSLDSFTDAYVKAALWSTNDEADDSGGEPLDSNYSVEHMDSETLQRMINDCAHFQKIYGHLLSDENFTGRSQSSVEEMAGHDFWLNRNGHGAGFWDGDWAAPVDNILDKASHSFVEFDLYVGDDGRIYGSGGTVSPEPVPELKAVGTPSP